MLIERGAGDPPAELALGDQLRRLRIAAGLTQEELAERAGLSVRGLSDLERGVRHAPYRDTVERLAEALGLAETQRAALLKARRLERGAQPSLVPDRSRAAAKTAHELPVWLTSFVGRERDVDEVRQLVLQTRLMTLGGPGGVGKTRLALQVAGQVAGRFADGTFFVPLAPIDEPGLVLSTVGHVVGVPEAPGRPVLDTLAAFFRDKHSLVVLDNFEHVLGAAESVATLVKRCPELHVLVTSRAVLRVSGEQEYVLASLSLPQAGEADWLEALTTSDAVRLFVERARRQVGVRAHPRQWACGGGGVRGAGWAATGNRAGGGSAALAVAAGDRGAVGRAAPAATYGGCQRCTRAAPELAPSDRLEL